MVWFWQSFIWKRPSVMETMFSWLNVLISFNETLHRGFYHSRSKWKPLVVPHWNSLSPMLSMVSWCPWPCEHRIHGSIFWLTWWAYGITHMSVRRRQHPPGKRNLAKFMPSDYIHFIKVHESNFHRKCRLPNFPRFGDIRHFVFSPCYPIGPNDKVQCQLFQQWTHFNGSLVH